MSDTVLAHTQNYNRKITKKKLGKATHVPTACVNCKKAHLACDLSRPCKRCSTLGKSDTCIDIQHKKRGRPRMSSTKKITKTPSLTSPVPLTYLSEPFISTESPALMPALSLTKSSFEMTQFQQKKSEEKLLPLEMMTMFLSMDLCCARASDESVQFFNMDPNSISHRSLYDLIHTESSQALSRIHRVLLDNCHHHITQPISFTPASSSDFLSTSPTQLLNIANGSQTLIESLKFKSSTYECKFYMGGGLGGDIFKPDTLSKLYIVCLISRTVTVPDILKENEMDLRVPDALPILNHYNNPTEEADLVNHLCEAIMSSSSVSSSSPSSSMIECNLLHSDDDEPFPKTVVSQEQEYVSLLGDFLHSSEHQKLNAVPMGGLVQDFLNDNSTYWLG
ncbi:hypothetical protein A0J61_08987 [Choanephora cucurbitarum]|uniref:Zn(2)-C6 fungal-type domain-containing protein n=1 Tax=Choanephora cucurbitarum TaxID=101091 RepID=A0A1C7N6L6_9FUNG|nr:hypothetical protein A0J61_08987 [Choanephora cucurbitarum]